MVERKLKFTTGEEVKAFVDAAGKCEFDIDILYQHAVIDGKSYLGILSLGLPKEVTVRYEGSNEGFESILEQYAMKQD